MMELETVGKMLIDIVRITINDKLENTTSLDEKQLLEKIPNLTKLGATFVTLTKDGELRGCIGSLVPRVSLYEDLKSNALKAAFEDPRFEPLTKEEFTQIKIEISIIGPTKHIVYNGFEDLRTKITPFEDGVILRLGQNQGTFLPQVWEQLPDFDSFMVHLFHKAGLDPAKVEEAPEIFTYKVDKIIEP
jgi:AmmeMemoRadiSam system protein A